MQIVIDIPDEVKEAFDSANIADVDCYVNDYDLLLGKAIKNGTPQEPRKGHWIDTNNLDTKYKSIYMCSNCRSCYTEMKPISMNFCPNCGADMRESEE